MSNTLKSELIEQGFLPSVQHARMLVPFVPVECCMTAADSRGLHHRIKPHNRTK